jgi:hypothetical protein
MNKVKYAQILLHLTLEIDITEINQLAMKPDNEIERDILSRILGKNDANIDKILDYIGIKIDQYDRLSDVSNDPSFFLGKIDALQDIRAFIFKHTR